MSSDTRRAGAKLVSHLTKGKGIPGAAKKSRHSDLFKEFKWSHFHFRVTTWPQQLHLKLLVNRTHQIL